MPLLTSRDADAQTEGTIRINDAGEIFFKQAVPNIFVLNQLAPIVEDNGGRLRISAPGVRAAMSRGLSLDQLLATLAHLHDGPLPAQVENNVRAWAGFYGQASLTIVHLLELSSMEVLNNLLHDEQVGQYLTTIESSATALALVDAEHVDKVRAVLLERGVVFKEA
jgi:hypothetical protein